MADESEGFVSRWSRLKRSDVTDERGRPAEAPPADEQPLVPVGESAGEDAGGDEADAPDLPPIEELTKDSDFTVFMRKGVPDAVRNQALRKLWTSDPILANLDGLVDYGEDFSLPFKQHAGKAVATLWRIGQGMPDPVKEAVLEAVEEGAGEQVDRPAAPAPDAVADSATEGGEDAPALEPKPGGTA